jgi:hypothetical protein
MAGCPSAPLAQILKLIQADVVLGPDVIGSDEAIMLEI